MEQNSKRIKQKKNVAMLLLMSMMFVSGCNKIGNWYISDSFQDTCLAASEHTQITVREANLIFMDYQNRYNRYYKDMGLSDFWEKEQGEMTVETYLKENRVKEELVCLLLLNDMAKDAGIQLTEEEENVCYEAAKHYYSGLNDEELLYTKAQLKDVTSLYQKYRLAEKMIQNMTKGSYLEISENDKRCISAQVICVASESQANGIAARIEAGSEFLKEARTESILSKVEYQVSKGEWNPLLEDVLFYLEKDEVSEVIEADGYYYILKFISDFKDSMTEEVEKRIYKENLSLQWIDAVKEKGGNGAVSIQETLWDTFGFFEADDLTTDNLYQIYYDSFSALNE